MTELLSAADEADALERLHALECTDGLPVVIPTPERVARLVLASGQDGDMVLGTMGPAGGVATVGKVATAAVMAGCLPDHMPVVIAAIQALREIQTILDQLPQSILKDCPDYAALRKAIVGTEGPADPPGIAPAPETPLPATAPETPAQPVPGAIAPADTNPAPPAGASP